VQRLSGALVISAASAARALPTQSLKLSWHQIDGFPNQLIMRLENPSAKALCVPDVDTKDGISFTQFGKSVDPFYFHNRAILQWRGADLISGLLVVPPKRRVDVFYDLNEWRLKRGRATALISIPTYDCLEFFRVGSPRARPATSQFRFNAPLSVAPND
jgi:hypothetical protein